MRDLNGLEQAIAYKFQNRTYLECALTHGSFVNEQFNSAVNDNERLEFLGDAVLGFVVADLLFEQSDRLNEGQMSKLRGFLVSAANLVRHAERIELGEYLRLGQGEEKTGGRRKPALLVNAFEALIAAVYLDAGMDRTREFLIGFFCDQIETVRDSSAATVDSWDSKSMLQESLQSQALGPAVYRLVEVKGPEHKKEFSVEVRVAGKVVSGGRGLTRKSAEQMAAKRAIEVLGLIRREEPRSSAGTGRDESL